LRLLLQGAEPKAAPLSLQDVRRMLCVFAG